MENDVELLRVTAPEQVADFLDHVDRIFRVTW